MNKPEILFLKQEDVIKAGALNMRKVMDIVEDCFRLLQEGKIRNPDKVFLGMPNDVDWKSFCMSMPAYISGEIDVVGFKWAAESMYNANQPGMPLGIDLIVLSDPKTVYPLAIMDGTLITAMRTAASAGICAKYGARNDSQIACLIGAGVIGRTMIMAMMEAIQDLKEIRITDLNMNKAKQLANEFNGKVKVFACDDLKDALKNADLVTTQTTARSSFIQKEWIKKNATVIQMEAFSYNEDVILSADRIILDNWSQMSNAKLGMIGRLYKSGKLKREDIYEIKEIVTNSVNARVSYEELVYCGTHGMAALDIAVATNLYQNARELNVGENLLLWDKPLWI